MLLPIRPHQAFGLMALGFCLFTTSIWLRSYLVWDCLFTPPVYGQIIDIRSERGRFGVQVPSASDSPPRWTSNVIVPHLAFFQFLDEFPKTVFIWRFDFLGFSVGRTIRFSFFVMPYYILTTPAVITSAYFLLLNRKCTTSITQSLFNNNTQA